MYQTYKPSGKLSFAFFPITFLMLLLAVPSISFLYVLITWYNPSSILDIVLYVISVAALAYYGDEWCIKTGKVRNTRAAKLCGVLIGSLFSYISIVFYYAFKLGEKDTVKIFIWNIKKVDFSLTNFLTALVHPENTAAAFKELIETGVVFGSMRGNELMTIKGGLLIGIWSVLFLITLFYMAFYLSSGSKEPFCEVSKKWAKKMILYLQYIEDSDALKKSLMFGDTEVLAQMEVLKNVNSSYSQIELYITEGTSNYYVNIENNKKKETGLSKSGEIKFDSEEIVEKLLIDRQTGKALQAMSRNSTNPVTAKVVTSKSKSSERFKLIKMILFSIIQVSLIFFAFSKLDSVKLFFSNGIVLFYMAVSLFIYLINFAGCFIKEEVVIENEEFYSADATKAYQVESKGSPSAYKLYYFVMLIFSSGILFYCIKESL